GALVCAIYDRGGAGDSRQGEASRRSRVQTAADARRSAYPSDEILSATGLPRCAAPRAGRQGAGMAHADPRLDPPPRPGAWRAHRRDTDGARLRPDGDREAAGDGDCVIFVGWVSGQSPRNPPSADRYSYIDVATSL